MHKTKHNSFNVYKVFLYSFLKKKQSTAQISTYSKKKKKTPKGQKGTVERCK